MLFACGLALALLAGAGLAEAGTVFHDDLNGSLNPAWSIVRQNAGYYSLQSTGLVLRCNARDLWEGNNLAINVFLIPNPAPADFTLTAKLRWLVPPSANWAQFALLAYDSDDDYVRVDHVFSDGVRYLQRLKEVGRRVSDVASVPVEFGTDWFWLQIRKQATNYSAWYSRDGVTFSPANPPLTYPNSRPAKLGFVAMVDLYTESATALIDWFRVEDTPEPAFPFGLDWWTVDGGGGTLTNNPFTLSATVGQPDAGGPTSVGRYSFNGGFWAMFAPNPDTYYPPLALTNGLTLWLAADFGVTNSGGKVSGWAGQSGAGHWAGQTSGGFQPTLLTNQLNGRPAVRFGSGGNHFLNLAAQVIASQQFTIIAATREFDSSGQYRELISNWAPAYGGWSVFFGTMGQNPVRARFTDDFGGYGCGQCGVGAIINPAAYFLFTGVSGTSSVAVYTNTVATAWRGTPLSGRTLTGLYTVGRQGSLDGEYWRGDIVELLVYDRELLAGELREVWQYLGDKYLPGTFVWPVITSATSASGKVNRPFSYTITATASPTGYGASGLPSGLGVNTASGLISGTPSAAGVFTVLLSATNNTGAGTTNLLLTIADNAPMQWAGNGHWYQAVWVGTPGITWPEAYAAATNSGGYLATTTSADENAFAYALVSDSIFWFIDAYGNGLGPWLGGLQLPPEPNGPWQWVTGEPMAYLNWGPGQPDNFGGNEDRIEFSGTGTLQGPKWNDLAAGVRVRGYLIEYPQLPGVPSLNITLSNAAVIVSWPAPAAGWLLHAATNLVTTGSVWTEIAPPYQTNGATLQVTEPMPTGNKFYRLHKR